MLRIAICDDIDTELQRIVALTNEYLTMHDMIAELWEFSHPDVLLTACEKENFHIFLLDMVMPMVSGLELGRDTSHQYRCTNHLHNHRAWICVGCLLSQHELCGTVG